MPVIFSALMCHAPIVIPVVAGRRAHMCERSTRAMKEIAARVVASKPDRLILISPHSPRIRNAFGAWSGFHRGNLAKFGHPDVSIRLPDAPEVSHGLGLQFIGTEEDELDHGAMVPLVFLCHAGWNGPTAILSLPWEGEDHEKVGRALQRLPGRTAVIASGDMSHRLKSGAPAGYHPSARDFDRSFVEALKNKDWSAIRNIPTQAIAAEDVVDSTRVAMAASGKPVNSEVLSYEGPWGVGYTQAIFYDPAPALYSIARAAVRDKALGVETRVPEGGPSAKGAFVTIWKDKKLRGCIGHIQPVRARLYEEIVSVARASASTDPRFPPVTPEELDSLDYEISVLEDPEPIRDTSELDPEKYGVIVQAGSKKGVLLPQISGIDTVKQQLSVACRKAGIAKGESVHLFRFTVTKLQAPS